MNTDEVHLTVLSEIPGFRVVRVGNPACYAESRVHKTLDAAMEEVKERLVAAARLAQMNAVLCLAFAPLPNQPFPDCRVMVTAALALVEHLTPEQRLEDRLVEAVSRSDSDAISDVSGLSAANRIRLMIADTFGSNFPAKVDPDDRAMMGRFLDIADQMDARSRGATNVE